MPAHIKPIAMGALAIVVLTAAQVASAASKDPYALLKPYEGSWSLTFSGGETLFVTNSCARLAAAFTCEQTVQGNAADLLIFIPTAKETGLDTYKTLAVDYTAKTPGAWNRLTIDGPHWLYESSVIEGGRVVYHRTLNDFEGPDHIHFTQQRSVDEKTWETTASGDEVRARARGHGILGL